jgi:hypothetical protein
MDGLGTENAEPTGETAGLFGSLSRRTSQKLIGRMPNFQY